MVDEVLPDLRGILDHLDSEFGKRSTVPNSGQHQQLWRIHRSPAQDDLPAGGNPSPFPADEVFDADCILAVEEHSAGLRIDPNREIGARSGRLQVGVSRAESGSATLAHHRLGKPARLR